MNSPVTEKVFVSMKCSRVLDSTLYDARHQLTFIPLSKRRTQCK